MTKKIAICTPIGRAPVPAYMHSLNQTMFSCRPGYQVGVVSDVGHANTPRIRNVLAQKALDYGFDILFWIDDDISWSPDTFWAVVEDEAPICGVPPRARRDSPEEIAFGCFLKDRVGPSRYHGNIATAFLKTEASALQKLEPHTDWFNYANLNSPGNPENIVRAWFDYEIGPNVSGDSRGYIGEDYWFCNFARKHGIEPVIRTDLGVSHWHTFPLEGRVDDFVKEEARQPEG